MTNPLTQNGYGYGGDFPCFVEKDNDGPYHFFVTLYHPLEPKRILDENLKLIHAAIGIGLNNQGWGRLREASGDLSLKWIMDNGFDKPYRGRFDEFHATLAVAGLNLWNYVNMVAVKDLSWKDQSLTFHSSGDAVTLRSTHLVPGRPGEIRQLVLARHEGPYVY